MPATRVIILGSTGSIGTQSVQVIEHLNALAAQHSTIGQTGSPHPTFRVVGLAAGSQADLVLAQAARLGVADIALASAAPSLAAPGLRVRVGADSACQLLREVPCDLVIAAIDGLAGLASTLVAAELGRRIALANKESLVAGGQLITDTCRRTGATLLPVDSEHSAIWQALLGLSPDRTAMLPPCHLPASVRTVWLTASGGPFRTRTLADVYDAPPSEALRHPTWAMGAKVTLDSATMVNKAFEMIEAHWLFGLSPERLGVLIHPQSVIHSIVELADGAQLAQLGSPDMRVPIQFALTHPHHLAGPARTLDWATTPRLDFTLADETRFEALALARRVMHLGGTAGAIFSAATQALSEAYRASDTSASPRVRFGQLVSIAGEALAAVPITDIRSLEDIQAASMLASEFVLRTARAADAHRPGDRIRSSHA
jgi:1-deoxy-D-xylulose-5-phosphate reductoisomerase